MSTFTGFDPAAFTFLRDLAAHNERPWFHAHREEYGRLLLGPARDLVCALGDSLARAGHPVHADPRVNGSIMRIARDTRFTADRRPYRTHLDLWLWEGDGPSRRAAGYFVRLDADTVTVGAGAFHFEQRALAAYRAAVADSRRGPALARAVGGALRAEARFGPARWKRVPAPYPADHPRADLLRRDGLAAATTDPRPDEAFTAAFPDWCVERLRPLRPLQRWVARVIAEAG